MIKKFLEKILLQKCYEEWEPWAKYFKKPTWIYRGRYKNPITKFFSIDIKQLWWKAKYGEPRHEKDPSIYIAFLWWRWEWELGCKDSFESMVYWESILWLYDLCKTSADEADMMYRDIDANTWSASKPGDIQNATRQLTEYGRKMYLKGLEDRRRQSSSVSTDSDTTMVDNNTED